uniref:Kinesin-like protein n=1 Tax=Kalanchoe fedtschenkoi TaxID=63787 RepID=A0A7N1A0M0_KALFE
MGGPMRQSKAADSLYDQYGAGGPYQNAAPGSDGGDAGVARWLQSAGLQHLTSPMASAGIDHHHLPNMLLQGYGAQTAEEKQRLFNLMRDLNFNGESTTESYLPTAQSLAACALGGFYLPDIRGDFGAGLLDLQAMDDTELLSEHVIPESLGFSPFVPDTSGVFGNDLDTAAASRQQKVPAESEFSSSLAVNEKENNAKENNVAKIKVVVRKRPLNRKELSRKEEDIVEVFDNAYVTVHEPKLKVDLTAYIEKHEFGFDEVLDENVTNDEVYRVTVEPIIPIIFQRTKATCFAYGQTGSGKTFTMQPLPLRASEDIFRLLHHPSYRNQRFKLWLSYFEIYGGKLYDLLSNRKKLMMREDGHQQVCIVGLQEFEVSDVQTVKEYIEKGNSARSTGSTGVNEESSRSHAILQLVVKKHSEVTEAKVGKLVGKISFIDLAGSERGADTTDNDRQTRIEGAEINKSLLALKECIRALDHDKIHIPFRGSKLTEVLRNSFVGNSRTVMISCISPNAGSCEHTLNTLRYADRVKCLSKSGHTKKDQTVIPFLPTKDALPTSFDYEDTSSKFPEGNGLDWGRRSVEAGHSNNSAVEFNRQPPSCTSNHSTGREQIPSISNTTDREKTEMRGNSGGPKYVPSGTHSSIGKEDPVHKVSSPRRKSSWEDKTEIPGNRSRKDNGIFDASSTSSQRQNLNSFSTNSSNKELGPLTDGSLNAILEEEEALLAAHRKEIEDTMETVREELKLLSEVEQPGSQIDNYVTQLCFLLSRKAAGLVSLQARLARFQHRLKELEILSRKRAPR